MRSRKNGVFSHLVRLAVLTVLCVLLAACGGKDDTTSVIEGRTMMQPDVPYTTADGVNYTLTAVEWVDETHTEFTLRFACANPGTQPCRFQLESGGWFASGGGSGLSIQQEDGSMAAGASAEWLVQVSRTAAQQAGPDSYSWFIFEICEVEYYLDLVQFF